MSSCVCLLYVKSVSVLCIHFPFTVGNGWTIVVTKCNSLFDVFEKFQPIWFFFVHVAVWKLFSQLWLTSVPFALLHILPCWEECAQDLAQPSAHDRLEQREQVQLQQQQPQQQQIVMDTSPSSARNTVSLRWIVQHCCFTLTQSMTLLFVYWTHTPILGTVHSHVMIENFVWKFGCGEGSDGRLVFSLQCMLAPSKFGCIWFSNCMCIIICALISIWLLQLINLLSMAGWDTLIICHILPMGVQMLLICIWSGQFREHLT